MCINNAAVPTFTRSKVFPPLPCTDTPLMTLPNVLNIIFNYGYLYNNNTPTEHFGPNQCAFIYI